MIGLLGATGYTGRLTAAALDAAGLLHRRGGRSAERLAALPTSRRATDVVVDVHRPDQLDAFLDGCDAVISTVGPFTRYGHPAVEAARRNGVPYVDSTGEPAFMRWVYQAHSDAPVPLVPACGFDYVPGDLAAAVATDALGGPDEVTDILVGYTMTTPVTRGTARSAIEAATSGAMTWRPEAVTIPFPDGGRPGVVIPWGEELTVPRRVPGARVRTALAVAGPVARTLGALRPVVGRAQPLVGGLRPLLSRAADRLPEGPTEAARQAARFRLVAVATARSGAMARATVEGRDVYGITADLLVACARRVAAAPAGAQTPATAFTAREILDAVPVTWRVRVDW